MGLGLKRQEIVEFTRNSNEMYDLWEPENASFIIADSFAVILFSLDP